MPVSEADLCADDPRTRGLYAPSCSRRRPLSGAPAAWPAPAAAAGLEFDGDGSPESLSAVAAWHVRGHRRRVEARARTPRRNSTTVRPLGRSGRTQRPRCIEARRGSSSGANASRTDRASGNSACPRRDRQVAPPLAPPPASAIDSRGDARAVTRLAAMAESGSGVALATDRNARLVWNASLGSANLRLSRLVAGQEAAPAIADPILVVGPWRSGTTVMHQLLAAASRAATPRTAVHERLRLRAHQSSADLARDHAADGLPDHQHRLASGRRVRPAQPRRRYLLSRVPRHLIGSGTPFDARPGALAREHDLARRSGSLHAGHAAVRPRPPARRGRRVVLLKSPSTFRLRALCAGSRHCVLSGSCATPKKSSCRTAACGRACSNSTG